MGQAIDFTGVSCKQQNGWDQKVAGVLHFTECVSQWKGTDKTKKNLVSGCFSNAYAPNWIAWKHGKFKGSQPHLVLQNVSLICVYAKDAFPYKPSRPGCMPYLQN